MEEVDKVTERVNNDDDSGKVGSAESGTEKKWLEGVISWG